MKDKLINANENMRQLIELCNIDENKSYLALPQFVGELQSVLLELLQIFLEEPEENASWISYIKDCINDISISVEKRDTIKLMDTFAYQLIPIFSQIIVICEE